MINNVSKKKNEKEFAFKYDEYDKTEFDMNDLSKT